MKKKIAVIGLKGLPAFGGAAAVGENLIEKLKERYDFTVYAISSHTAHRGNYKGIRQFVIRKFPVNKFNVLYYYIISALHTVIFGRYDFIHLHHIDGAVILLILRLRYKVISTSHGRIYLYEKWSPIVKKFFRMNEKLFIKYSNIVVSVSSDIANYYRSITDKEIQYIANGVNLNAPCKDLSEVKDANYILFAAGRILPEKGCHVLLEALNQINYKGKLLIIGNLDHMPKYKDTLFELSSNLNVEFIDLIKDKSLLNAYIRKAIFFVFPSSREAMSMMLLEVATFRTPLICSDIPENMAVFDEYDVLVFRTDSVTDLSDKLTFAINNPRKMIEFSEKAFQKLESNYQWKDLALKYEKLYDKILVKN